MIYICIYTKYSTLPSGISVYIVPKVGMLEPGVQAYFEYLVYYIGYSLLGTTVSVATHPLTMRSIRGGTLGWNIEYIPPLRTNLIGPFHAPM